MVDFHIDYESRLTYIHMGLRGPAPLPTAIHIANGNPSKRPLNADEPKYLAGVPERPAGMSAAARKWWDFYVDQMRPTNVLRIVDGPLLADLCEEKAELEEMRRGLRAKMAEMAREWKADALKWNAEHPEEKRSTAVPGGARTYFAGTTQGQRVSAHMRALKFSVDRQMREFGLTPSSNSRVQSRYDGKRAGDSISSAMTSRKQKQAEAVN